VASRGHARNQINLKGANSTDVSATGIFVNGHVYADQDIADHFRPFPSIQRADLESASWLQGTGYGSRSSSCFSEISIWRSCQSIR
jgi:hypothetical protein